MAEEKELDNQVIERKRAIIGEKKEDIVKLSERTDVEKMSKAEVEAEIKELEELAAKVQKDLSETEYPIKIENESYLKELIKFIEHDAPWQHINAALIISVYQELKSAKVKGIDKDGNIWLLGKDVATIYNSLAQRTGKGYYQAKNHVHLITIIGETVSEAMKMIADDNKALRDIHTRLADLDKRLEAIAIQELGIKEEDVKEVKKKSKKLDNLKKKNFEVDEKVNSVVNE